MNMVQRFAFALMVAAFVAAPAMAQLKPDMVKKIEDAVAQAKLTVKASKKHKVLVFNYAAGFVHGSIPYGTKMVELMGEKTGAFECVVSDKPSAFDDLSGYSAIIMVNTTGDWLLPRGPGGEPKKDDKDYDAKLARWKEAKAKYDAEIADAKARYEQRRKNILDFLANGGGLVGFHSASDAQYHWKEFGLIIGGYFWGHPWHEKVAVKLDDPSHPLLAVFGGKDFEITDEIYQFKDPYSRSNLRILLRLDVPRTNMKKGGIHRTDGDFAVAWIRSYEKGHIFYSSLGHREEIYWNPAIVQFYLDGIQFALGDMKADAAPSKPLPADVVAAANETIAAAKKAMEEEAKKKGK